eukprot:2952834-Pyramimonas_sp.AAC.1
MWSDLKTEASRYGLAVHFGKTRILANCELTGGASVRVGEDDVSILAPDAAEKYLVRLVSVGNFQAAELTNRMNAAWRAFAKCKSGLCS